MTHGHQSESQFSLKSYVVEEGSKMHKYSSLGMCECFLTFFTPVLIHSIRSEHAEPALPKVPELIWGFDIPLFCWMHSEALIALGAIK